MKPKVRLYLQERITEDVLLEIFGNQFHYLTKVMRLQVSDGINCFNGVDGLWEAELVEISNKSCKLVPKKLIQSQNSCSKLTLLFAPIKNESASYIVQKATELGVTDIYPVLTKHSVIRNVNHEKLILTAIEAAEQCERIDIPRVFPMQPLSQCLGNKPFSGTMIFCCERYREEPIKVSLGKITTSDNALLIGPEGGFSKEELEMLKNMPMILPVSLGHHILRTETAVVSALAIYQAILGYM